MCVTHAGRHHRGFPSFTWKIFLFFSFFLSFYFVSPFQFYCPLWEKATQTRAQMKRCWREGGREGRKGKEGGKRSPMNVLRLGYLRGNSPLDIIIIWFCFTSICSLHRIPADSGAPRRGFRWPSHPQKNPIRNSHQSKSIQVNSGTPSLPQTIPDWPFTTSNGSIESF